MADLGPTQEQIDRMDAERRRRQQNEAPRPEQTGSIVVKQIMPWGEKLLVLSTDGKLYFGELSAPRTFPTAFLVLVKFHITI